MLAQNPTAAIYLLQLLDKPDLTGSDSRFKKYSFFQRQRKNHGHQGNHAYAEDVHRGGIANACSENVINSSDFPACFLDS